MCDGQGISEKIEKLERSNRRLSVAVAATIGGLLLVVILGAASPVPKVLEAEKFVLRDDAGNERAELFVSDKSAGLLLVNKNNSRAATLVVGSETNALMLWDHNGNLRQVLSSDLDESAWNVFRPGSETAQISVTDNGKGTALVIRDRANRDRVGLGVSPQGSAVVLEDDQGVTRTLVTGDADGFATFTKDGSIEWSPDLANMSADEQKRLKGILPKLPK